MILNEKETEILYHLLWASRKGFLDPHSVADTDHGQEEYRALAQRIDDETDLGWASEVSITIESR